jgi:VWFA-related protein
MTSPVRRSLAAVGVSVFTAWVAHAAQGQPPQQPQQPPPPPRPPVFRAGSVLVTVDVYPQRDGKLVDGLTATDFQVLEDGKPQAIDGLELVRVERTLSEAERRDPNSTREMWSLAADPRNRVFVVFLDSLHVTIEGSYNVRRPLIDTLDRLIAPNDLFALMTPNLQARHLAFGRRMLSVEEQLTRYWPWGERGRITSDLNDPVEDALTRCFQYLPLPAQSEWFVEDDGVIRRLDQVLIDRRREDRTLTSLEDLVTFLTNRREARTVMVLLSEGWRLYQPDRRLAEEAAKAGMRVPGVYGGATGGAGTTGGGLGRPSPLATTSDPAICIQELARLADLDNAQRFRALLTQAGRANISVYPVAASGLAAFDTSIKERTTATGTGVSPLVVDRKRLVARVQSLQALAENTDGIAIVNTNDLAGGMRRIVEDVSSYYLLTYYSTNPRNDGRYRKIEVRTKQPGLTIRARRGYLAPTESDVAASAKPGGRPAPEAAGPPADAVPVDAVFAPLSRLRAGAEVFTYGGVARPDVLFASVELGSTQLVSGPFAKGADVRVAAALAGVGPAEATSMTVNTRIEAGTRGVLVRLLVPPASSGQAGASQAPATPRLWQVTATIGSGADRLQERFEIRWATGTLLGDPMPFRATPAPTSPLRAVADFVYRRTERVHIAWPLLGAVDRREARLIARNGQVVPLPVALSERSDNGQTVIAADLTLTPLAPADYAIELVVGQGANSERRYVAFRVVQ